MSWSSRKKKSAFFLTFILSERNSFNICVLFQCIAYCILQYIIYTFTYQKTLHCGFLKSLKAFSVSLILNAGFLTKNLNGLEFCQQFCHQTFANNQCYLPYPFTQLLNHINTCTRHIIKFQLVYLTLTYFFSENFVCSTKSDSFFWFYPHSPVPCKGINLGRPFFGRLFHH